jgi:iron-sulfur cluster assembly protein
MITLTAAAISKAKSVLAERKEKSALRIAVVGGGCSGFQYQMTLDSHEQSDDKVIEMDGLNVLVDSRSFLYLNGATIDYVENASGSGFKFDNPNAQTAYRSGEAFEA